MPSTSTPSVRFSQGENGSLSLASNSVDPYLKPGTLPPLPEADNVSTTSSQSVHKYHVKIDDFHTNNEEDSIDSENERLKQKKKRGMFGRRLSWVSVGTASLSEPLHLLVREDRHIAEKFHLLLTPPEFDRDDLLSSVHTFLSSLADYIPSVKMDKTFQVFSGIRTLLKTNSCVRLYGLLIHYMYWNILHPAARKAIEEVKRHDEEQRLKNEREAEIDARRRISKKSSPPRRPDPIPFEQVVFNEQDIIENRVQLPKAMRDIEEHEARQLSRQRSRGSLQGGLDGTEEDNEEAGAKDHTLTSGDHHMEDDNRSHHSVASHASRRSQHSSASKRSTTTPPRPQDAKNLDEIDQIFEHQLGQSEMDKLFHEVGDFRNAEEVQSIRSKMSTRQDDMSFDEHNQFNMESSIGGSTVATSATAASLTANEKEQLFIQLETCIVYLFHKMGRTRFGLVTGRQALISCCHFVVDEILTMLYPWFAAIPDSSHRSADSMNSDNTKYTLLYDTLRDLNKRIRRLLHQSLSDLIDPSRSYTSTMLLNAVMGYGNTPNLTAVGKKSKALMSSEAKLNNKGRFYRTSPSILALFGDSGSSEARKFLQRNAPLYTPIPGVVTPFQVKLDKVKEWDMPAASMENLSRINSANIETSRPTSTMAMNGTSRPGSSLRMTGTGSRPGTQQSLHSTQDGISPLKERKSKKKLDFHRLFEAQPDAHFYPPEMYGEDTLRPDDHDISFHPGSEVSTDLRINDIVEVADAVEKQIQEIKNRKVYTSNILPYTLPLDVPKHKSNSSANVGGFKVTTAFIEQGANVLLSNSHSKLTFGEEKRVLYNARDNAHPKKSNAQNGKKKSLGHGFQSQSNDRLVLSSTGQYVHESELNMQYAMHKHGDAHDDHSLSSATDNRSLVHNKASDIPISLKAKTALMNLMVDKAKRQYMSTMQTDITKLRISLIQGDELVHKKHK